MASTRVNLVSVPVDCIHPAELEDKIMELVMREGPKQICFVSIWDILKARCNKEYMECLKKADLLLPVSKSILQGAKFLKLPELYRYNPFPTVITILGKLEKHYKSLYLLGGHKDTLMTVERNFRSTFPGLQIVGRYVGYYPKTMEKDVVSAIHKASPSLLLISDGLSGGNCWSFRRYKQFSSTISLYAKDLFKIFAKQKKRISQEVFDKGLEIWAEIFKNPFKILLIFPYIWYKILLVWYKLFKRNKEIQG